MQQVGKETFEKEVLQADRPVIVDFWGPQCGPCLALMPSMEMLAEQHKDRLKIVKVEAPSNRRLCLQLKVISLPTFLIYKDGKEIDRLSGNVTLKSIEDAIEKIL
jgi:thioredoxin 1